MPSELDGVVVIEVLKKLDEGFGTMRSEEEDIMNKTQPEAGLLQSRMK